MIFKPLFHTIVFPIVVFLQPVPTGYKSHSTICMQTSVVLYTTHDKQWFSSSTDLVDEDVSNALDEEAAVAPPIHQGVSLALQQPAEEAAVRLQQVFQHGEHLWRSAKIIKQ